MLNLKSNVITFSHENNVCTHSCMLNICEIEHKYEIRDLGVFWDDTLRIEAQVNAVVASSLRMLGMMFRITRNLKNPKRLIVLYNCFVHSRLEFALTTWNSLTSSRLARIEGAKRGVIRLIYDRCLGKKYYYDYNWLRRKLKITTLP